MKKSTITYISIGIVCALVILLSLWSFMQPGIPSVERTKESVKLVLKFRQCSSVLETLKSASCGSAFVINDDGCLATNAHVVGNAADDGSYVMPTPEDILYVVYEKKIAGDRKVIMQKATVVQLDSSRDLAYLRVAPDRTTLRPLRLGNNAKSNQIITALGFPMLYDRENLTWKQVIYTVLDQYLIKERKLLAERLVLDWTSEWADILNVTTVGGSISQIRSGKLNTRPGQDATMGIITHTAAVHEGMSGGPLVNDKGEVVGVTYAALMSKGKTDGGDSIDIPVLNSAIDVEELRHFLTRGGVVLPVNPDGFISRIRAYLSVAKPYEVALAVLGIVFTIGALTSLTFMAVGKQRKPHNHRGIGRAQSRASVPSFDSPTTPMVEAEPPTKPFLLNDCSQEEVSIVLTGKDPDGNPLRFRFTEKELQSRRSLLIGSRRGSCEILLPFNYISRQQARLCYEQDCSGNGLLFITDENSTNTTCVNGEPIRGKCPLEPGDRITLGPVILTLSAE